MPKLGEYTNQGSRPWRELKESLMEALPNWYSPEEKIDLCKRAISLVTGLSHTQLLLEPLVNWSEKKQQAWELMGMRLQKGEPWQYISGETFFCGLALKISPGVLIPRPETEAMCALILENHKRESGLILADACTGSGCIALSLAAGLNNPVVHALDISTEALKQTADNAQRLGLPLQLHNWDALHDPFPLENIDILVSNPPYITEQESYLMRPNVLEYEPHLALFAPTGDALAFYRVLSGLGNKLKPGGSVYLEVNEAKADDVVKCFTVAGFSDAEIINDLSGKPRVVRAKNKE